MLIAMVCVLGSMSVDGDTPPPPGPPTGFLVRVLEMDGLGWRQGVYHRMEPLGEQGVACLWAAEPSCVEALVAAAKSTRGLRGMATGPDNAVKVVQRTDRGFLTGLRRTADGPVGEATMVGYAPVIKQVADGVEVDVSGHAEGPGFRLKAAIQDTRVGTVHDVTLTETVGKPDAGPQTVHPRFQVPEVYRAAVEGEWTLGRGKALVVSMGAQTKYDEASKSASVGERLIVIEVDEGPAQRLPMPRPLVSPMALAPGERMGRDLYLDLVVAKPGTPACCPATFCDAATAEMAMPATPSRTFPAGHVAEALIDDMAVIAASGAGPMPSPQARPIATRADLLAWTEGPWKRAIPDGVVVPKLSKAQKVMVTALTVNGAGEQVGFDMDLRPGCDPAAVGRMTVPADVKVYSVKVLGTPEGEARPSIVLDLLVRDGKPVVESPRQMLLHAAQNWATSVVDFGVSLAEYVAGGPDEDQDAEQISLRDAFTSAIMHGDAARVVAEPRPAGPGESSPLVIAPAGVGNGSTVKVDAAALLVEVERRYWTLDAALKGVACCHDLVAEAQSAQAEYEARYAGKLDPRVRADAQSTLGRFRQKLDEATAGAAQAETSLRLILGAPADKTGHVQTITPPLGEFEVEDYETCLKAMREHSPTLVARRRAARAAELRAAIAAEPMFVGQDAAAMAAHGLPAVDPETARTAAEGCADGLRQAEHEASHQLAGRYIDADSAGRGLKTARRLLEASKNRVRIERAALDEHPERLLAYLEALQSCGSSYRIEADLVCKLNLAVADFELTKGTFLEHAHVAVATRPADPKPDAQVSRTSIEPPLPPQAAPAWVRYGWSFGPFLKLEIKGEPMGR